MNSKPGKRNEYSNEALARGTRKKRAPKEITEEYLYNAGLYYLQRFAADTEQFRRIMAAKIKTSCFFHRHQDEDSCVKMLESLIVKFTELGLLDDPAYARAAVNSMRRQGRSKKAIAARLAARGLNETLVGEALAGHDEREYESPAEAELHAALVFAKRKRLGPFAHLKNTPAAKETAERNLEKAMGAFGRAGFSFDMARRVLDMAPEEALEKIRL